VRGYRHHQPCDYYYDCRLVAQIAIMCANEMPSNIYLTTLSKINESVTRTNEYP